MGFKYNGLEVSNGNLKLGTDTLILNMGSAKDCPSLKLGLCKLGKKCYAMKPEKLYKGTLPYRERQAAYWKSTDGHAIALDFIKLLGKHKALAKRVKYLRVNEAGDFYSQECVEKLNTVARILKDTYGIQTYTYTARKDLDFTGVCFVVKGSGHWQGNNGRTIAMHKKDIELNRVNHHEIGLLTKFKGKPAQHILYRVCPMDCRECTLCKHKNGLNIVFPLH